MKRRDFLRTAVSAGLLYGLGGLPALSPGALASGFAASSQRVLAHVMLSGGPDFRHLFPPAFDPRVSSYGYRHWSARAGAQSLADSASAFKTRWNDGYFPVSHGSVEFGILKSCGWLKRMWDAGSVAIVANVVGGTSRNHAHCELVMDQGNPDAGVLDADRPGWGGKLATAAGGNIVALTPSPRRFCFGPHPYDPASHDNTTLIAARNTRDMGLYSPGAGVPPKAMRAVLSRGLQGYYQAKHQALGRESPYFRFTQHERSLRDIGGALEGRLSGVPLPSSITALMQGGLMNPGFGGQIRNLYDTFACSDLLNLRVASLEYTGFDSHKAQRATIESRFSDLFGDGKALDVLHQELPPDVLSNTVFLLGGEFGRQLRANGDHGTDHGTGNTIILIGSGVRGGLYGNMFPESELEILDTPSADIVGLTGMDHLFARVCDWVESGCGSRVFAGGFTSPLESGLNLDILFT